MDGKIYLNKYVLQQSWNPSFKGFSQVYHRSTADPTWACTDSSGPSLLVGSVPKRICSKSKGLMLRSKRQNTSV